MRRKVALLLASVMTLAAVAPTTAFASSKNKVTRQETGLKKKTLIPEAALKAPRNIDADDEIVKIKDVAMVAEGIELELTNESEIRYNDEFTISLENGEFYYAEDGVYINGKQAGTFEKNGWFEGVRPFGSPKVSGNPIDQKELVHDVDLGAGATQDQVDDANKELQEAKVALEVFNVFAAIIAQSKEDYIDADDPTNNNVYYSSNVRDAVDGFDFSVAGTTSTDLKTNFATKVSSSVSGLNDPDLVAGVTVTVPTSSLSAFNAAVNNLSNVILNAGGTGSDVTTAVNDAITAAQTKLTAAAKTPQAAVETEVSTGVAALTADVETKQGDLDALLLQFVGTDIPYKMVIGEDRTEAKIYVDANEVASLFPYGTENAYGKGAKLIIPLVVVTQDDEDVRVRVTDTMSSVFSATSHTIATYKGGGTTTTIKSVKEGRDVIALDRITIKENRLGALQDGWVHLSAPKGYYFKDAVVQADIMGQFNEKVTLVQSIFQSGSWGGYDYHTDMYLKLAFRDKDKTPATYFLDNVVLIPESDNEPFNEDLYLTIEGVKGESLPSDTAFNGFRTDKSSGIDKESVKVAKRVDWLIDLEVKKVEEFLSGFRNQKAGQIIMTEKAPNAWWSAKRTQFILTDEDGKVLDEAKFSAIKFSDSNTDLEKTSASNWVGADSDEYLRFEQDTVAQPDSGRYVQKNKNIFLEFASDAHTITLTGATVDKDKKAKVTLDFKISTQAGFEGPVYLKVAGSGVNEEVPPVKIAEVYAPIKVTTKVTPAQIGFTNYDVASIEITETKAGRLERGKTVKLYLEGEYAAPTGYHMKFAEVKDSDVSVSEDSKFQMVRLDGGRYDTPEFEVRRESSQPVTIRIDNVRVHIDRTVPFGNYDLVVGGSAISDNGYISNNVVGKDGKVLGPAYNRTNVTPANVDNRLNYDEFKFGGIVFENYINVDTPGDGVAKNNVKVQQNSSVAIVNGEEIELGSPTYINEGGNMMVPVRFVSYALGLSEKDVTWDPYQSKAFIRTDKRTVVFTSHSEFMNIDGNDVTMVGASGEIVKSEISAEYERMYIPFRALAEAFNIKVAWHADTKIAEYNPIED